MKRQNFKSLDDVKNYQTVNGTLAVIMQYLLWITFIIDKHFEIIVLGGDDDKALDAFAEQSTSFTVVQMFLDENADLNSAEKMAYQAAQLKEAQLVSDKIDKMKEDGFTEDDLELGANRSIQALAKRLVSELKGIGFNASLKQVIFLNDLSEMAGDPEDDKSIQEAGQAILELFDLGVSKPQSEYPDYAQTVLENLSVKFHEVVSDTLLTCVTVANPVMPEQIMTVFVWDVTDKNVKIVWAVLNQCIEDQDHFLEEHAKEAVYRAEGVNHYLKQAD